MCHALKVSRGGYYAWKDHPLSPRGQENEKLLAKIHEIHQESRQVYGSPRMTEELRDQGYASSENRVARLMRVNGIRARTKKAFKVTTDSNHCYQVAPNLWGRQFTVESRDVTWVGDITYIPTREGWLYLATVLDLYSRKVVGWAMEGYMSQELVLKALDQAVAARRPDPGLMFHSDRGSQYAAHDYQTALTDYGMICSMSRKGDCWDNAVAESFFHSLKTELVQFEDYQTRQEAKRSIFHYIEAFYNRKRRHSFLGYLSPEAFENAA